MSLLSKLAKGAVGFLAGGPAGAAAGLLAPSGSRAQRPMIAPAFATPDSVRTTVPGFWGNTTQTSYFTQPGQNKQLPATMSKAAGCGLVLVNGRYKATRMNKSTYVTRGGGTSRWQRGLVVHEKGTECVTVRRRNVGNAKALRRSISRVRGFLKLYRKAAGLVGHRRAQAKAAGKK